MLGVFIPYTYNSRIYEQLKTLQFYLVTRQLLTHTLHFLFFSLIFIGTQTLVQYYKVKSSLIFFFFPLIFIGTRTYFYYHTFWIFCHSTTHFPLRYLSIIFFFLYLNLYATLMDCFLLQNLLGSHVFLPHLFIYFSLSFTLCYVLHGSLLLVLDTLNTIVQLHFEIYKPGNWSNLIEF